MNRNTILFLCLLIAASTLSADEIKGKIILDGKSLTVNHVYFRFEPSLLDETKKNLVLVFSDRPVTVDQRNSFDIATLAANGKLYAIEVRYSPESKGIVGGNIYHQVYGDRSVALGGSLHMKADLSTVSADQVKGRVYSTEPLDRAGHKWEIDVDFHVQPPRAGAPLSLQ